MASVIRYGSAKLLASKESSPGTLFSMGLISDISFGFNINREEIKSMGFDHMVHNVGRPPTVNISFSYIISDLENEELLGFPVTSSESIKMGRSIVYDIKPVDLAFVVADDTRDYNDLSSSQQQELKVCVVKNAYINSYSISLNPQSLPEVSVSLTGENMIFKIFKNLSEYTSIDSLTASSRIGGNLKFKVNDGTREPTSEVGGAEIVSTVDSFDFSLDIPYREMVDFGQFYHKKKVNFPLHANLSISSVVNGISEGELKNIFCQENLDRFTVSFTDDGCTKGPDEMSGMLFLNAMLVSQDYRMSTSRSNFFRTNLNFKIDVTRDCGVFFTQQVTTGEYLLREEGDGILLLEIADTDGTPRGILSEGVIDMFESLSTVTCSHH